MLEDYSRDLLTVTYTAAPSVGVYAPPPSLEQVQAAEVAVHEAIAAGEMRPVAGEVEHFFSPGQYTRKCTIEAGAIVVGKMHRHQHPVFLMQGTVAINTDRGMEIIEAPHIWISQPNAKRVLRTVTECVFATVHLNPTDTQDLDAIEAEVIVPAGQLTHEGMDALSDALQGAYA